VTVTCVPEVNPVITGGNRMIPQKRTPAHALPKASRPYMPAHGLRKSIKGLFPWTLVRLRLEKLHSYWAGAVFGVLLSCAGAVAAEPVARVYYHAVLKGRFAIAGTWVRTLPPGDTCLTAGVPLYRGILPLGPHGITLDVIPTDELAPYGVPRLDMPYTHLDNASSVSLAEDADLGTFGINQSGGSGSIIYHADGSGQFEFSGWKNALGERESGLVRWICRPECQGNGSSCQGDICKECRDGSCLNKTDPEQSFDPMAANLNPVSPPEEVPVFSEYKCGDGATVPVELHLAISARCDGGRWSAVLTEAIQDYYMVARLLSPEQEVTGPPPGNTTQQNYKDQFLDLCWKTCDKQTGTSSARWGLLEATEAHERVHVAALLEILRKDIREIERSVKSLSVPTGPGKSQAQAVREILALPDFKKVLKSAQEMVRNDYLERNTKDHSGDAPDNASKAVREAMRAAICRYAQQNGWPPCPVCPEKMP
jgi:hypothetical protein